jgi:hypothetical protein
MNKHIHPTQDRLRDDEHGKKSQDPIRKLPEGWNTYEENINELCAQRRENDGIGKKRREHTKSGPQPRSRKTPKGGMKMASLSDVKGVDSGTK